MSHHLPGERKGILRKEDLRVSIIWAKTQAQDLLSHSEMTTPWIMTLGNNITVLENTTDTSHKVTRGCMCSDRGAPDDGHRGVRNM
jgi:hypothetical protein